MGLSLLVGPANAGKVALLSERYLAVLGRAGLEASPSSSCRTDRTSSASSVISWLGAPRSSAARSGRSTTSLPGSRTAAGRGACFRTRAQPARPADRRRRLAERPRALRALRGLRRLARRDPRRARVGARRSRGARRRSRPPLRVVPRGARPARPLGSRRPAEACRRTTANRLRRLARRARLRVRLRGSDRRRVGAAARARRRTDGDGLAAVRAGARRVRVAASDDGRPRARSPDGRIEELPARFHEFAHPALAHLERSLFVDAPRRRRRSRAPFASSRARARARPSSSLRRRSSGSFAAARAPERIAIVCPSLERWRSPLETGLGGLGVPLAIAVRPRLPQTPFGRALLGLLRFTWLGGGRRELYGFLRTPYSGVARAKVDFLEGRLRGRAINAHDRVEAETLALHGNPFPIVEGAARGGDAARRAARDRRANARACTRPSGAARRRRRARRPPRVRSRSPARRRARRWLVARRHADRARRSSAALERTTVRGDDGREPGRVAVLDLLRARTRSFEVVFLLGLEEGSLPRRTQASPFLDDDARRAIAGARLVKPDQVARDRYLFYTACTRATRRLYLVREAASDEGTPREPSPFWDEVVRLFPPTTCVARRRGGRCRRSRGRSTRRRPSASGCGRSPRSRPPTREDAERARARERLGAAARPRAARHSTRADAAAPPARPRVPRRADELQRDRARALLGLLVRVVRRPAARSADDRRRGRPEAARLGRAQRAAQVLQRHPEGARRRAARGDGARRALPFLRALPRPGGERRAHGADRAPAAGARPDALARPRGVRAHRGVVGAAARPEPLRGVVRRRTLDARRARPRRRPLALREDRPRRRRDVRRARDRAGLQVGPLGALGAADHAGAAAADPALHARAARPRRDRAARRSLPPARRGAQAARVAARERAARSCRASRGTTTWKTTSSGRGSRRRGATHVARAADSRRRRAARSAQRLLPVVVRSAGRCAG